MDLLKALGELFSRYSAETLMALFGAFTSITLFYLVWSLLRYFFSLLANTTSQEADQDKTTAALMETLISALIAEAGHLRQALDGLLDESLRCGEQNAQALTLLLVRSEKLPTEVLDLLKPEFELLHQEMLQAEARIMSKLVEEFPVALGEDK